MHKVLNISIRWLSIATAIGLTVMLYGVTMVVGFG